MKKTTFTCLLFALGLANAVSGQGLGLVLRLESDVRQKLPGVPLPLRLVAVNNSTTEKRLPFDVFIHVEREGGERFLGGMRTGWARKATDEELDQPGFDGSLPIAAGATVIADLDVGPQSDTPSFLLHPFLWPAGRYTIRMLAAVDEGRLADAIREATLQSVLEAMPEVTISNPLTIDVTEPQGADAEAWQYLREASEGEGWYSRFAPVFAKELRRRFPTSQYTFSFGLAHLRDESLADLEALAKRARSATPRPLMLDWLEMTIAGTHEYQCAKNLRVPRDVDAAASECETARTLFAQIVGTTTSSIVRASASRAVDKTLTAADVRNWALHRDAVDAGTYQPIRPLLQCVKETGRRLEAAFSYTNSNAFTVYIDAGVRNFFTPGPENRGQPVVFVPGTHEGVVTVTIEGKMKDPLRTIAWTLDEITVSAPANGAPRCKGN